MSAVLKHNPDFKQQPVGQKLVEKLFMVQDYFNLIKTRSPVTIAIVSKILVKSDSPLLVLSQNTGNK